MQTDASSVQRPFAAEEDDISITADEDSDEEDELDALPLRREQIQMLHLLQQCAVVDSDYEGVVALTRMIDKQELQKLKEVKQTTLDAFFRR